VLRFEVGVAMALVLVPIDLVVDSIGANGCLHALDRAHIRDGFQGDLQDDLKDSSQGDSQNDSLDDFLDSCWDGFQAWALVVIALQSVSRAKGRRNVAFQVLSPASPLARSCYTGSRSVDTGKTGAVDAVAVLDPLESARNGLREHRHAQIASIFFAAFCPMKIQNGSMFFALLGW
jgi:hypothetical protein